MTIGFAVFAIGIVLFVYASKVVRPVLRAWGVGLMAYGVVTVGLTLAFG